MLCYGLPENFREGKNGLRSAYRKTLITNAHSLGVLSNNPEGRTGGSAILGPMRWIPTRIKGAPLLRRAYNFRIWKGRWIFRFVKKENGLNIFFEGTPKRNSTLGVPAWAEPLPDIDPPGKKRAGGDQSFDKSKTTFSDHLFLDIIRNRPNRGVMRPAFVAG